MITSSIRAIFIFAASLSCCQTAFAQKKVLFLFDSTLETNSEGWKVDFHQGFKRSPKTQFGPYTTLPIKTVEEQKDYRMLVAGTADTAELSFSVSRFWHRRSSTLPDRLLSSDFSLIGRKGDITVAYGFKIAGIVANAYDSIPSRFFMEDSVSNLVLTARFSHWHLVTINDSLYTEPFKLQFGKPGKKFYEFREGVYVNNAAGVRIAALKFTLSNKSPEPNYVWIRKDIDARQKQMIASLFSLMMVSRSDYFW